MQQGVPGPGVPSPHEPAFAGLSVPEPGAQLLPLVSVVRMGLLCISQALRLGYRAQHGLLKEELSESPPTQ